MVWQASLERDISSLSLDSVRVSDRVRKFLSNSGKEGPHEKNTRQVEPEGTVADILRAHSARPPPCLSDKLCWITVKKVPATWMFVTRCYIERRFALLNKLS